MILIQEVNEQIKKATTLSNFIGHDYRFERLDIAEQERLKVQNDNLWAYIESLQARLEAYKDGESCGHPGCLNHFTQPCENCGRIAGIMYLLANRVSFTYLGYSNGFLNLKCSGCNSIFECIGTNKPVCPNCGGE